MIALKTIHYTNCHRENLTLLDNTLTTFQNMVFQNLKQLKPLLPDTRYVIHAYNHFCDFLLFKIFHSSKSILPPPAFPLLQNTGEGEGRDPRWRSVVPAHRALVLILNRRAYRC